jgi:cytochrome c553
MSATQIATMALAALLAGTALGVAAPSTLTDTIKECEVCHDSYNEAVPRLEGQSVPYLVARIRSFADLTRQSPHAYVMFDVNSGLPDATILAVAKYFSAKAPTEAAVGGALAGMGELLYRNGVGPNIRACQGCHGARAEGDKAVPRLAGQHAVYLRAQLQDFSMRTRVHDTMNAHIRDLNEEQIDALVAYLAKN